jgi:hypothetical protein|nr:MAG TPA: hypothetical protein [Caudoviricetes sp.]
MAGLVGCGWMWGAVGWLWLVVGFQRLTVCSLFLCGAEWLNWSGWSGWLGVKHHQPIAN